MKGKLHPRCFFDIDIGHSPAGRIVFELFDDICPKTVENFKKLCTGEAGIGQTTKVKLHYANTIFHRVIKGFMIQGGDFVSSDGTGGESIYGGRFADENFEVQHDKPFLLCMANCGPNTNGSQFFITTKTTPDLNGKYVVFGHVISGQNLIESIENLPVTSSHKPVVDATISNCGELIPVRKKKTKRQKEKAASIDSSSSKGKKKKKNKKRKKNKKNKKSSKKEDEEEEIDGEQQPLCSVRPDEIPEIPKPYYLYRGNLKEEESRKSAVKVDDLDQDLVNNHRYVSKDTIGKSGRIIKGRGQLRYMSKSPRDRSETPPHWKRDKDTTTQRDLSDRDSDNFRSNIKRNKRNRSPSSNSPDEIVTKSSRKEELSVNQTDKSKVDKKRRVSDNNVNNSSNKQHLSTDETNVNVSLTKSTSNKWQTEIDGGKSKPPKSSDKENYKRRSGSKDQNKQHQTDKTTGLSSNKLPEKSSSQFNKMGRILFPYGDESDEDESNGRAVNKHLDREKEKELADKRVKRDQQKIIITSHLDKRDEKSKEPSKQTRNEVASQQLPSKNHRSAIRQSKSRTPPQRKPTHSPPAYLIAKWQSRREKIRNRHISREKDRHSRRGSSRRYHSRNSRSPSRHRRERSTSSRKVSHDRNRRDRSSSGTADSSPSSVGSSALNDSAKQQIPTTVKEPESMTNQEMKKNDISNSPADKNNSDSIQADVVTNGSSNNNYAVPEVIKSSDKPWIVNQWNTEDEEQQTIDVNDNNGQPSNVEAKGGSVLAKLREDDKKNLPLSDAAGLVIATTATDNSKKQQPTTAQSPIFSQSISKYRSPSGTASRKGSRGRSRSSYSSSKSRSALVRSRSRSRNRSNSRRPFNRRSSRYRRRSRSRGNSRRCRPRYRSRSRSYSRPRRSYSGSESSSRSRSSRYSRQRRRSSRSFRRSPVSSRHRR